MPSPKKHQTWLILGITVIVSLGLVAYAAYYSNVITLVLHRLGFFGPLLSIALYALLSASPIPSDPLSLINGAVFGPIAGTIISWIGNMVAAMIEYFIGEKIADVADFEDKRKELPFGLDKFQADSTWFLIFGRFIPEFGGKIVSLVGGLYHVPLWRYVWTAAIATLLGSAIFALGGYGLVSLF